MSNAITISLLYGCSDYQPPSIPDTNCGRNDEKIGALSEGYQKNNLTLSINGENLSFDLADLNSLRSKRLTEKHFTKCHLYKYKCKKDAIPSSLPFIYERDKKVWTDEELYEVGTWYPRMRLFFAAYKCEDIFSVSIVPKNSSIKQTWYLKKTFIYENLYQYCQGGEEQRFGNSYHNGMAKPEDPQPKDFQGGFIKPFPTYYSDSYRPTIENTDDAKLISNQNDIDEAIQVYPERSQIQVGSLLSIFLEDTEATHIGIVSLNPFKKEIFFKV